jgi:hypothetical protein
LRTQRQLLERDDGTSRIDPSLYVVGAFESRLLSGHKSQYHRLVWRDEPQGFEGSCAGSVVLQKVSVHIQVVEQNLGDRVVPARRSPVAAAIPATYVNRERHVVRAGRDSAVERIDVDPQQLIRIEAPYLLAANLGITQKSERDVVKLKVAAAGRGKRRNFLLVCDYEIFKEIRDLRIEL